LLEVDFPNNKEQSDKVKQQNEKLSKAFRVQAFPTLMLCDAEGRPYAEAGFPDEMEPESMLKVLDEQKEVRVQRDAAFAKAEKAVGVEKAKLLLGALGLVPAATVPSAYGKTIDEIAKLYPDDKAGFVKKAKVQQALAGLEAKFAELMGAEKPDEAIKCIDSFVAEHKPEGEAKQKALLFKVFGLASKENFKDAIQVADEIVKIDDKTETAAMVKQIKQQLENQ
jgi:hypothetical protein